MLGVLVPSALGGGHSGPRASIACKRIAPGVCEESGDINVSPNSTGSQTVNDPPAKATAASSFIEPLNASELADFDSVWDTVVKVYPKLTDIKSVTVRRVLTCALFTSRKADIFHGTYGKTATEDEVAGSNAAAGFLAMCLQVAVLGQKTPAARDAKASGTCSQALVSVALKITRTSSGYRIHPTGTTFKPVRPAGLVTSCQAKGSGLVINVRTRKRQQNLTKIVGGHFSVGYSNPTSKSVGLRDTFTFR
jgi:hypothetical protein